MSLFDRIKNLLRFNTPTPSVTKAETTQHKSLFSKVRKSLSTIFTRRPKGTEPEQAAKQEPKKPEPTQQKKVTSDFSKQIKKELNKNAEATRKKFYEQSDKQVGKPEDAPYKSDIILQELERRIERWEAALAPVTEDDYEFYPKKLRNFNLRAYLEDQIATYGRAKVAYSCENAGKVLITNAEIYVWASEQNQNSIEAAWSMIETLLSGGEVPSLEERKMVGEDMDNMQDYNPFEE